MELAHNIGLAIQVIVELLGLITVGPIVLLLVFGVLRIAVVFFLGWFWQR